MRYLRECVDSILAQDTADFELVVTDDASTDGSFEYLQEVATHDARLRLLQNKKRLGLVGNWNCGVGAARGEWVKLVFQDDVLFPNCLSTMLAVAQKEGTDFLACRRDFIFDEDTTAETRAFYEENAREIDGFYQSGNHVTPEAFAAATLQHIGRNFVGEPTVTLLRRSVFERFGLFNEHLIMSCDSEFWSRVGTNCGLTHVSETLARFRVHQGSTSAGNFGQHGFRTVRLDPMVIAHEFATHPVYEKLRRFAAANLGAHYVEDQLIQHVQRALAAAELELAEPTLPQVLDQVAAPLPRLRRLIWKERFRLWTERRPVFRYVARALSSLCRLSGLPFRSKPR